MLAQSTFLLACALALQSINAEVQNNVLNCCELLEKAPGFCPNSQGCKESESPRQALKNVWKEDQRRADNILSTLRNRTFTAFFENVSTRVQELDAMGLPSTGYVAQVFLEIGCFLEKEYNVSWRHKSRDDDTTKPFDMDHTCHPGIMNGSISICVGDWWELHDRSILVPSSASVDRDPIFWMPRKKEGEVDGQKWFAVLKPFEPEVWGYLVLICFGLGLLMSLVEDNDGRASFTHLVVSCDVQATKYVLWHGLRRFYRRSAPRGIAAMFGSGQSPKTRAGQWLGFLFYFVLLIQSGTFTGKIAANLTLREQTVLAKDLDEAADKNFLVCTLEELNSSLTHQGFASDNLKADFLDYDAMFNASECQGYVAGQHALFDAQTERPTDLCDITTWGHSVMWASTVFYLHQDLQRPFSFLITILREDAIIQKLHTEHKEKTRKAKNAECDDEPDDSSTDRTLGLDHFEGFFKLVVTLAGVIVGATLLHRLVYNRIKPKPASQPWTYAFGNAVFKIPAAYWGGISAVRHDKNGPRFLHEVRNDQIPGLDQDLWTKAGPTNMPGKLSRHSKIHDSIDSFHNAMARLFMDWDMFKRLSESQVTKLAESNLQGHAAPLLRHLLVLFWRAHTPTLQAEPAVLRQLPSALPSGDMAAPFPQPSAFDLSPALILAEGTGTPVYGDAVNLSVPSTLVV